MGFIIWVIVSFGFIILGVLCLRSKKDKPIGFWSNAKVFKVNNVNDYNKALGKLWIAYGIALAIMGIPLLDGQNSPLIMITLIGTMFLTVILMVVYMTFIESKYRVR